MVLKILRKKEVKFMFNKISEVATKVANKVKDFCSSKQTEVMAKAHAVLDGTV